MRTNLSVFWEGIRKARAESMNSISLEAISAAERTSGLPCVNLGVGEEVAGAGAEEERRKLDEGQVRTKISVFGEGLPETRAESTISTSLC